MVLSLFPLEIGVGGENDGGMGGIRGNGIK